MITLKQLKYLSALDEYRHFGRAAEACAISQPALSMQIRDLEDDLGVKLVERRRGDVTLTEIGIEVARRGDHLLSGARDLEDFARHRGRLLTGNLSLGIIPTLAPYVLPKILPELQKRHGDLTVELRETQTKQLLDELVRGSLDVVLLALPVEVSELDTLELFEDQFLLAVPANDPRSPGSRIKTTEVDATQLILLEEGHCLRDQALAYCGTDRRGSALGLGATSLATVMQMVANGFGITLVPKVAADVEVRDGRVKLLDFAQPQPGRTVGLAWRRTSPRRSDFVALGEVVKSALGKV